MSFRHEMGVRVAVFMCVECGASVEEAARLLSITGERVRQLLAEAGEITGYQHIKPRYVLVPIEQAHEEARG